MSPPPGGWAVFIIFSFIWIGAGIPVTLILIAEYWQYYSSVSKRQQRIMKGVHLGLVASVAFVGALVLLIKML